MSDFRPRITVIIPALNEETALPHILADLSQQPVEEVVVVDNGSTDRTAEVARAGGATVVSEPRRGYGWACFAGVEYLTTRAPDIVVFMDGDYSDHAEELPALVQPIVAQGYDLVIGSRTKGENEPGALVPHARTEQDVSGRKLVRNTHAVSRDAASPAAITRRRPT